MLTVKNITKKQCEAGELLITLNQRHGGKKCLEIKMQGSNCYVYHTTNRYDKKIKKGAQSIKNRNPAPFGYSSVYAHPSSEAFCGRRADYPGKTETYRNESSQLSTN